MDAQFWNDKYSGSDYFFGRDPHPFFAEKIKDVEPGKILIPADGEGRHGIYAAKLGWDVTIMDYSDEGKQKALQLAKQNNVQIKYEILDLFHAKLPNEKYDAIGMVYAHFLSDYQDSIHRNLWSTLKKGGHLILVGFGKEQLNYQSGGPPEKEMLYDVDELKTQFEGAEILEKFDGIKHIREGDVLQGKAHQIYLHIQKKGI